MIAMRGLQGYFGGVLIPMAFTLVFTKLPKGQQPIGLAMFALAVTFAPAIGPTIGGYLTENYGWQTIFFVNVVPTAIMVAMLYFTLERQPMQLALLREGDWFGIVTMAVGLSALQAVLEEGNKDDWFGSPFIVKLAIIAAISLSLFIANELIVEKPLLRLRLPTNRNFGMGTTAAVFLGFGLFGSIYLLPAYLGQVQGYNAEQIGNVLAWTGLPQLLLIPLVPKLMQRIDARYLAAFGLVLFAYSSFMNTTMSLDYSGDQFWIPNIVRAIGQALTLAPLSNVSLGSVAPQDAAAASGISNMMRNLGGAIGTAVLATIVTKREQFHSNIIGQSVDLGREEVRNRIAEMTQLLPEPRCGRSGRRASAGHHRARQGREAPGAGARLQRHLHGARRRAALVGCRDPADAQGKGHGGRRRRALGNNGLTPGGPGPPLAGRDFCCRRYHKSTKLGMPTFTEKADNGG